MRTSLRARAIEYEVVSRHRAAAMTGVPPVELESCLGEIDAVAVVKCASGEDVRLTALGDPRSLREVLREKPEAQPEIVLATSQWPIILRGWLSEVPAGTPHL